MNAHMKHTLRNVMMATVASGLLLSACSTSDAEKQQPKMDTSSLRAPANNPQFANGEVAAPDGLRAPEGNPQNLAQDSAQVMPQLPQEDAMAAAQPMEEVQPAAEPKKESGGLFSWAWKKQPKAEPQVNTMERRVPVLNQDPSAEFAPAGMANYEAAAPVGDVDMSADMALQQPQLAPQSDIVVADEVIMMDDTFTPVEQVAQAPVAEEGDYPSLASVPLRPERLDAVNEKDARMADLQAARDESAMQGQNLNTQMASDMEGSLMPQTADNGAMTQSEMDAEFAALVAADKAAAAGHGQPVVVMEEVPAVIVDNGMDAYEQAPAPITMVDSQPLAPQLQPQTQPVEAPQANEWVSLQQDPAAQMAVPVEQVDVANSPEVVAVSAIPVMPEGEVAGGIQLTPPSAFGNTVRTLPESRYAARRQAVYMQRYSRMQQAGDY